MHHVLQVALAQDVIEAVQLAREDAEEAGLGSSAISLATEQASYVRSRQVK